jgi:hypothetical protein
MKSKIKMLLKDERGEFGIKQIALTVAVIVVIGFAITAIQGLLPGWITQIWTMFIDQIKKLMS